jgi:sec-independent protein translocase protein TatA
MSPLALFGPIGTWELVIILLLILLLFGGRRIPEIARGLGEGIRNFRTSLRGEGTKDEGPEARRDIGSKSDQGS